MGLFDFLKPGEKERQARFAKYGKFSGAMVQVTQGEKLPSSNEDATLELGVKNTCGGWLKRVRVQVMNKKSFGISGENLLELDALTPDQTKTYYLKCRFDSPGEHILELRTFYGDEDGDELPFTSSSLTVNVL